MITRRFGLSCYSLIWAAIAMPVYAAPVISEFMAENSSTLADQDGAFSDWIEIRNPDTNPLNLSGWHLTDDASLPNKWTFPAVTIPAKGHLIVFASNKDRAIAGTELHTNFKLSSAGEYLALVQPGGAVEQAFSPKFPEQISDYSFGLEGSEIQLLSAGSPVSYLIPEDGTLGLNWTNNSFNDSTWLSVSPATQNFVSPNIPKTASNAFFSSSSGIASSTLAVSGMPVISSGMILKCNITHSGSSRFTADLISPEGTSLLITGNQGVDRIIEIDLQQFNGESPNGNWTLRLTESGGFFDSGSSTLQSWSLKMSSGAPRALVSGVGFEDSPAAVVNYSSEIATALPSGTSSAYIRQTFNVADPSTVEGLKLRMKYDDGFVAYLNGVKVAEANAPASPAWNSLASAPQPDEAALEFVDFDLSPYTAALNAGSNNVLAVHMLNETTTSSDLLMVAELIAGTTGSGEPASGYIVAPSPGVINTTAVFSGLLGDTSFTFKRGFFSSPFSETITSTDPGASLIYTTNGSVPTESNGARVDPADDFSLATATLPINTTTVLRVIAVKDNHIPTNVDTQTYIFTADVLQQDGAGLPTPPNPSASTWDYEMDPDVVNDPRFNDLENDLLSLPVISIVMPESDIWGSNGIYANPEELGSAWERGCSIEVLNPDGSPNYQTDGGLKMQGAGSRARAIGKKSMRLVFRKKYGDSTFDYPMWGATGPDGIGTMVLRGNYFDSWSVHTDGSSEGISRTNALQIRTHFATISAQAMGLHTIATTWSHLYINGQYWGIFDSHERPDKEFAELHLGGNEDDYTVLKHRIRGSSNGSPPEVSHGDLVKWNELMTLMSGDASQTSVYNQILGHIDVSNLIDYILLNFWGGNKDWPHNNWYAIRHNPSDGPFVFYVWDPENYMFNFNEDRTGVNTNNSPGIIYDRLRTNAEFQLLFADHVRRHMFNGGALSVPEMSQRWQTLSNALQSPMNAESARWGDEHTSSPFNTYDHWLPEVDRRLNDYIPDRNDTLISQLRAKNLYPATDAPDFSQHGGQVASGYLLNISNPNAGGTIYYTTDGSDPRLTGGIVSGTAMVYSSALPISANITIKARILDGGDWSALNEADFRLAALASASTLVVSEFSYNPAEPSAAEIAAGFNDADDFEFVEIQNISAEAIDLRNVEFALGVTFDFSASPVSVLAPGERLVVAENEAAFVFRYGAGVTVAGQFAGKLSNGGEQIILQDNSGSLIQSFTYNDKYPWPESADGQGASLVLINPFSNPHPDIANHWRASALVGGTPGGEQSLPHFPSSPMTDANGNGRIDLLDYAMPNHPLANRINIDGSDFLSLEFQQVANAEQAELSVEYSEDMNTWQSGDAAVKLVSETYNPDGTITYRWRAIQPSSAADRQFMRVKITELAP